MAISELTLKLIIILIPGALGTIIVGKLTVMRDVTPFKFVLNSIIIGVSSYLLYQLMFNGYILIINLFNCQKRPYTGLQIWNSLSNSKIIPYTEILLSNIFSVIVAFSASAIENFKLINKLAKKIGVSQKYGEENLFSYFLNARETHMVYIRNVKLNLTYYGYVNSYSETDTLSEIVLSNVQVFRYEDSEPLYDIDQIYLSFQKTDLIIEHAKILTNGEETTAAAQTSE